MLLLRVSDQTARALTEENEKLHAEPALPRIRIRTPMRVVEGAATKWRRKFYTCAHADLAKMEGARTMQ